MVVWIWTNRASSRVSRSKGVEVAMVLLLSKAAVGCALWCGRMGSVSQPVSDRGRFGFSILFNQSID